MVWKAPIRPTLHTRVWQVSRYPFTPPLHLFREGWVHKSLTNINMPCHTTHVKPWETNGIVTWEVWGAVAEEDCRGTAYRIATWFSKLKGEVRRKNVEKAYKSPPSYPFERL